MWTCRRQIKGRICGRTNDGRRRKCVSCGRPKPVRRRPAHMSALDLDYAAYIELNGGEHCAICGKVPQGRRLDRDHDHKTGKPRGLLCWSCNRQLRTWATVEWLRSAAAYLERAA
jgi:Recombination endonuclease VII